MSSAPLTHGKHFWAPLGYQQYTSLASAINLSGYPPEATIAEIIIEGAAIRYRDDGTAPTSSIGMPVTAGNAFQYSGDLSAIQFIAQSAGAIINISYYK